MARSPFSGTFQPNARPTVTTAPDAIVYINGEIQIQGCPQCNRFFEFNKYITSVQVDLSIDSVPGSASISLAVPRHSIDDFYFDGNPVITPMMEVEVYAKGYYLVEGLPQYYPIFWGIVTEVNDAYSSGEHTVSVHCADILKWWELCKMNIHPAFTVPNGQQGRNLFGNVFFGTNPYDVIWSLALQSYGDVLIGTGSMISVVKEQQQKPTFDAALSDLMIYWEQRFKRIRSNLLLYGVNGVVIRGDSLDQFYSTKDKGTPGQPYASTALRNASGSGDSGQEVFDPTDPGVQAFRTQFNQAATVDFWQSEYQTKLEIANAAKESIGFEFYMDVDGSIVFKPPFYNLDVLSNKPVSWIQDIDIIDWDISESESEVVTQIILQGSFGGNIEYGLPEEATPFTSVTDYHLLRKYGWRSQNYNSEFMRDPLLMFYHGLDVLDRLNSRRHRATVTIPFRPELRLGFPIYLASKDQIWYVSGISHNIAFGGRATTSLTLTAKRGKFIAPKGVATLSLNPESVKSPPPTAGNSKNSARLSFKYTSRQLSKYAHFDLKMNNAGTLPPTNTDQAAGTDNPYDPLILRHPKTGRILGYPNLVMVYTRPFSPADSDLRSVASIKDPGTNPYTAKNLQAKLANTATQEAKSIYDRNQVTTFDQVKEKYSTNRYQYGLNSAGVYVYARDASDGGKGVIGEMLLLPSANVNVTPKPTTGTLLSGNTSMVRPVSDERGFEVIGHYRYGRRVSLRDGRLILTGNVNDKANIDLQLSMSGGLYETLTAQSQGLTTISSAYANPADAVARMQPDDLQTAAIVNPDTKKTEYIDVGDNFVDAAPLGSPEQQGQVASVEASQLSRALTLAEMSVKQPGTVQDADCSCLLGRADLAFMNVGYQVQTISTASTDKSFVPSGSGTTSQTQINSLNTQVTALQTQLATAQRALAQVDAQKTPLLFQAAQQKVNDTQTQLSTAQTALNDANNTSLGQSNSTPVPNSKELILKVDLFLTNLYKALDADHQRDEKTLRGDLLPGGAGPDGTNAGDTNFLPPAPSEFAPPFNPALRLQLGDPNALVGQIQSNASNLSNAWGQFGTQLKNAAKRTQLTQEIATATRDLSRLQGQRAQLLKAESSSTSFLAPSAADQIASLDVEIQRLRQTISQDQAQLNQLPAK